MMHLFFLVRSLGDKIIMLCLKHTRKHSLGALHDSISKVFEKIASIITRRKRNYFPSSFFLIEIILGKSSFKNIAETLLFLTSCQ